MAKERDHSVTAKLQVQIVIKIDIFEKKPFKTIFSAGVDTISPGTQKRTTKLAIGALIAPEIPHVPSIGINPHNIPSLNGVRHSYGSRVWGTIPGAFDRTGGHRHQKGARIGRIWELGAEKCWEPGFNEIGINYGPGRFFNGGSDGKEMEANGKRVRWCWEKK